MADTFYRYRGEDGAWVVTDRLEAVPPPARVEAQRIDISDLPDLARPAEAAAEPRTTGTAEGPPAGPAGDDAELADWVQKARESVAVPPAPRLDIDGPSFGFGLGLGLTAFVVYGLIRRSGRLVTRLAMLALVVALLGTSIAGLWLAPHVPGAPEWLMTPDQLIREAQRVAEDAALEKRLGDLK